MTGTGYVPTGKTFDKRMQDVLKRRERWLSEHMEAGACTVLVHPADKDTVGYCLVRRTSPGRCCRAADPASGKSGLLTLRR